MIRWEVRDSVGVATIDRPERRNALNAATLFELDDVIDPADTRRLISSTLAAASDPAPPTDPRPLDTW